MIASHLRRWRRRLPAPWRARAYNQLLALRRRQSAWRALPHFIIVGAQKAGTSSLYAYLRQHPQIAPAVTKEVHFFDIQFARGMAWYRAHFPLRVRLGRNRITGEATPYYLFHPLALQRIHWLLPRVKIVVLLRDPVERAISHYFDVVRQGHETLSLGDALAAEDARLRGEQQRLLRHPNANSLPLNRHSYRTRGVYAPQVARLTTLFPAERRLILPSGRFFARPESVLNEIHRFLGIDGGFTPPDLRPRNTGRYATQIDPTLRRSLRAFFKPHNLALADLLDDQPAWQRTIAAWNDAG